MADESVMACWAQEGVPEKMHSWRRFVGRAPAYMQADIIAQDTERDAGTPLKNRMDIGLQSIDRRWEAGR